MAKSEITNSVPNSSKNKTSTGLIPTPPPIEGQASLHTEIPAQVDWRMKLALLLMEGEGRKVSKKQFVQESLVAALDKFDAERGG